MASLHHKHLCFLQIVTNIYEPQGISYVDAHATFLTNDLLPLVDKKVTDKKVLSWAGAHRPAYLLFLCTSFGG